MTATIVIVVLAAYTALMLYMTPSFVAAARHHHNERAIIALNVLLGWTLLGWAAALVWALTATRSAAPSD